MFSKIRNNTKSNYPIMKSKRMSVPLQIFASCYTKMNRYIMVIFMFFLGKVTEQIMYQFH